MLYATLKVLITSVLVIAVSEAARRSSVLGALLASLPLVSVLAFIWLYVETGDSDKIASLAHGIFWLCCPRSFFSWRCRFCSATAWASIQASAYLSR